MRRQPTDPRRIPHQAGLGGLLLSTALFLPAWPAGALGLGDLRLESYIGEPLESTLTLRTSEEEELSADCFDVVQGAERDFPSLSGARITLERGDNRAQLKIRTLSPVSEPVMRLRVASSCSSGGGLSRDYLLLFDPRPETRVALAAAAPTALPAPAAAVTTQAVAPPPPSAPTVPQAAARPPTPPTAPPTTAPKGPPKSQAPTAPPAQLPPSAAPGSPPPAASAPARPAPPPPAPTRADGAFRLRLSAGELDTSRSLDVDERKRAEIRERRLLLEQDDQTAALLGLRENLRQLETQLAELQRQVTAARSGAASETARPSGPAKEPPAAAQEEPAKAPAAKAPVPAEPAVDWVWVLLGVILASAAGGLTLWKRLAERRAGGYPAELAPQAPSASPTLDRVPAREAPHLRPEPDRMATALAEPPPKLNTKSPPSSEERHDPAQVRLHYRHSRFPELARGELTLSDPTAVVTAARTLYEDGALSRAMELLELAIADDPAPMSPWLALLEIHRREGMASEFCALAARFQRQHGKSPQWPKVQSIGKVFDPYNSLFAVPGEAQPYNPTADNWLAMPVGSSADGEAAALHAEAAARALARTKD